MYICGEKTGTWRKYVTHDSIFSLNKKASFTAESVWGCSGGKGAQEGLREVVKVIFGMPLGGWGGECHIFTKQISMKGAQCQEKLWIKSYFGGAWMGQLAKWWILDFGSGHDQVLGLSPASGSLLRGESAWDFLFPSPFTPNPTPYTPTHTLCLFGINKHIFLKKDLFLSKPITMSIPCAKS